MGQLRLENGDIYNGQWYEGQKSGFGFYQHHSGEIYEGTWFQDRRQGKGKFLFHNGNKFSGVYDNNDIVHGRYIFADGTELVLEEEHMKNFDKDLKDMNIYSVLM